jgi:Domain of unknown function (DUF397)
VNDEREIGWHKSSFSTQSGNCVETAQLSTGEIAVRDSKNPGGTALRFTLAEWQAFLAGVRAGEHDYESRTL